MWIIIPTLGWKTQDVWNHQAESKMTPRILVTGVNMDFSEKQVPGTPKMRWFIIFFPTKPVPKIYRKGPFLSILVKGYPNLQPTQLQRETWQVSLNVPLYDMPLYRPIPGMKIR